VVKQKSMKKSDIVLIALAFIASGAIVIYLFSSKIIEITSIKESDYLRAEEYSGIVVEKFINTKQHNYKTVIIEQNGESYTILFDFEMGGFYEFIEVGDSISKRKGTLDVQLIRKDLDTIVTMQIYNRWKRKNNL